jgi:hypothetical protein
MPWMELRAPRANPVFCTDEKRIRTENTVMYKNKDGLSGFHQRSSIARGCAFHPCAIEDPRGRAAVRASSGVTVRSSLFRPRNIALCK